MAEEHQELLKAVDDPGLLGTVVKEEIKDEEDPGEGTSTGPRQTPRPKIYGSDNFALYISPAIEATASYTHASMSVDFCDLCIGLFMVSDIIYFS